MLYPLKFKPQYQYRLWGGNKLRDLLGKTDAPEKTGESWEISAVQGSVSVVANGYLAGNDLEEIIEVYMGDLVGDAVYEKFGPEFPLLIKLIDANEVLSIQVHPDDKLAHKRHNAFGKTEMWYILQSDPDAKLYVGFNQKLNRESYLEYFNNHKIAEILNEEKVAPGDLFFIPSGRVHAAGAGILFAEIQQTSDITYRIYDWDRLEKNGKPRHLHTDLALDAIDFTWHPEYKTPYQSLNDKVNPMIRCPYFITNLIIATQNIDRDYITLDSFVILLCLEGFCHLDYGEDDPVTLKMGETLLIPAALKQIRITPVKPTRLLEVYIDSSEETHHD